LLQGGVKAGPRQGPQQGVNALAIRAYDGDIATAYKLRASGTQSFEMRYTCA
jgi:hypothetical protein